MTYLKSNDLFGKLAPERLFEQVPHPMLIADHLLTPDNIGAMIRLADNIGASEICFSSSSNSSHKLSFTIGFKPRQHPLVFQRRNRFAQDCARRQNHRRHRNRRQRHLHLRNATSWKRGLHRRQRELWSEWGTAGAMRHGSLYSRARPNALA